MQIGYHRLEGKIMPLKKPLAILKRTTSTDSRVASSSSTNINDKTIVTTNTANIATSTATSNYQVIDILRHKIIFNTRPEPVGLME
jgi:hypothetical protein